MSINKKSSRTERLNALRTKMREDSSPKSNSQKQDDERFWKPSKDATGTGSAIIRFLPAKTGEEFPYVQLHTHGFQGPTNRWFIDNCPTTIGETCPVCKANTGLWNSGVESNKKLASSRKRKLNYISNVLVVNDPKQPEKNGKVYLFSYGKKIFDKLMEMIDPPAEFGDMEPLDPFDPVEGANFKLRIVKQDGFPNYDRSAFDTTPTPIGDEDRQAEIMGQLYSLNELVDPSHFKGYADLKKRFDMVTGETSTEEATEETGLEDSDTAEATSTPAPKATAPKSSAPKTTPKTSAAAAPADDSDDFFANLAKQSAS